jgi:tryptophan 7-halogenase
MGRLLGKERLKTALESLKTNIAGAVEKMPTHKEFLDRYCSLADAHEQRH